MAKKKEEQLTYLQMPIPNGRRYSRAVKRSWSGLNYRQTLDTGAMSMECNISTAEAPYLTPSQSMEILTTSHGSVINYNYGNTTEPISMFGFDDFLLVIYEFHDNNQHSIKVDYITYKNGEKVIYTSDLKTEDATAERYITDKDRVPRSVVQFNLYDTPTDPLRGEYVKKLIIFPDKKVMDFNVHGNNFDVNDLEADIRKYYNDDNPEIIVVKNEEEEEEEVTIYPPPENAAKDKYYYNTYEEDKNFYHTGGGGLFRRLSPIFSMQRCTCQGYSAWVTAEFMQADIIPIQTGI